jgi:hypothetical protein
MKQLLQVDANEINNINISNFTFIDAINMVLVSNKVGEREVLSEYI